MLDSGKAGLETVLSFLQILFFMIFQFYRVKALAHIPYFFESLLFLLKGWNQDLFVVFFLNFFIQRFLLLDLDQFFLALLL